MNVIIGTHAIFQENLIYKNLGLVVIDEQHRCGVHQRLSLQKKSTSGRADLLLMTATPIPRTLIQTKYGDINFSKLEQTFEFHRYNLGSCRVFIQNYTSNKLIIHITIYDLETNSVYEKYEEEKCS